MYILTPLFLYKLSMFALFCMSSAYKIEISVNDLLVQTLRNVQSV